MGGSKIHQTNQRGRAKIWKWQLEQCQRKKENHTRYKEKYSARAQKTHEPCAQQKYRMSAILQKYANLGPELLRLDLTRDRKAGENRNRAPAQLNIYSSRRKTHGIKY